MSLRRYLLLAVMGVGLALLPALFQSSPGYMDADYYFAGGLRLADGSGFSELILWNYLDNPAGLPHPSHGYWMPLPSILSALGLLLSRGDAMATSFAMARLPFLLLAALIPVLTAHLALALYSTPVGTTAGPGSLTPAWFAGALAVVPGFYLAYLPTIDSFGLVMVSGALFFITLTAWERLPQASVRRQMGYALILGGLAGFIHLCRADGLLWVPVAMLAVLLKKDVPWGRRLGLVALVAAGYALVMGPWFLRNLAVFGSPLAPGGARGLWITSYDELYLYPAGLLTPQHWMQAGWGPVIQARWWAAGQNLQTALAVQGSIFLLPLIVLGAWRLRHRLAAQVGGLLWVFILLMMTVVFPFQGARGGFFHSGAAIQPLFWVLAVAGLDGFLAWGARLRGWNLSQAGPFFRVTLLGMAFLLTSFLAFSRVGVVPGQPAGWNAASRRYQQVEQVLVGQGAPAEAIVMVNNPPGYYAANRRPAVSIPFGDLEMVRTVAERYQVRYLLVELEQVKGADLLAHPGDRPGLQYAGVVDGVQIYVFQDQ